MGRDRGCADGRGDTREPPRPPSRPAVPAGHAGRPGWRGARDDRRDPVGRSAAGTARGRRERRRGRCAGGLAAAGWGVRGRRRPAPGDALSAGPQVGRGGGTWSRRRGVQRQDRDTHARHARGDRRGRPAADRRHLIRTAGSSRPRAGGRGPGQPATRLSGRSRTPDRRLGARCRRAGRAGGSTASAAQGRGAV